MATADQFDQFSPSTRQLLRPFKTPISFAIGSQYRCNGSCPHSFQAQAFIKRHCVSLKDRAFKSTADNFVTSSYIQRPPARRGGGSLNLACIHFSKDTVHSGSQRRAHVLYTNLRARTKSLALCWSAMYGCPASAMSQYKHMKWSGEINAIPQPLQQSLTSFS